MKKTLAVIIFLLLTNQTYADKKFEKDLKIISKLSTFVNNRGENYKISLIKIEALNKVLVMSHNKDAFETPETLSFLANSPKVKFLDLSDTNCKAKKTLRGYHTITLAHCFANKDFRSKEIIKYLEEIY